MSDHYICSDCSRSFRTAESFVNHAKFTGHSQGDDPAAENEFWADHYSQADAPERSL